MLMIVTVFALLVTYTQVTIWQMNNRPIEINYEPRYVSPTPVQCTERMSKEEAEKRLKVYIQIQKAYAEAMAKQPLVPEIVIANVK